MEEKSLEVPGKADYDWTSYKGVPFQPDGDESCGACIRTCPTGARKYHGEQYQAAKSGFEARCAAYREPEIYII